MIAAGVTLRPATDDDYDFMRRLYHSTRVEEMARFPFDEEQKRAFLDSQFAAQFRHYATHYPACERSIVEIGGAPGGRIWVDERNDEIRVVDIALLPQFRGSGIGTTLMRDVLSRAARCGKPVTIHVEAFNRAQRLYERLGFVKTDSNGVYFLMRWTPDQVKTAS